MVLWCVCDDAERAEEKWLMLKNQKVRDSESGKQAQL
jgi:hypothetical protein